MYNTVHLANNTQNHDVAQGKVHTHKKMLQKLKCSWTDKKII